MKAMVEKDACAGCGLCVDVCPDVFEMDAEDKAKVKVNPVPSEAEAGCRDAADQCPTSAILVDD
ncbi:MAG: ferredoxin [Thermoguttaceae bacterium]|jgi:ferredoxin